MPKPTEKPIQGPIYELIAANDRGWTRMEIRQELNLTAQQIQSPLKNLITDGKIVPREGRYYLNTNQRVTEPALTIIQTHGRTKDRGSA